MWKLSFFVIFIILAFTAVWVGRDIYQERNLNVKASDFYSFKGTAEQLVFKQSRSKAFGSGQIVEIYLKGQNVKWIYSSQAPGYLKLVNALRKCQNVEFLFKTTDLLKNKEAEIWNANVCGENAVNFKEVLEYKYSGYQNTNQLVKMTLVIFFLFLLFSFFYFLFKKF